MLLADLGDLRLQAPQDYLDRTGIKDDFLTRLFDLYLIQAAAVASRPVFDVAVLLGWFELQRHEADPATFQVAHLRHVVHWDRVPKLLTDPTGLLRETYGWGTATFDADALVTRLGGVLQHLAAEVRRRELPVIPLARLHGGDPACTPAADPTLRPAAWLERPAGRRRRDIGLRSAAHRPRCRRRWARPRAVCRRHREPAHPVVIDAVRGTVRPSGPRQRPGAGVAAR